MPSKVDGRSDVWSFGVVVYFCLTGTLPFPGATFEAVCLAVDQGKFPRASRVNRALPARLDTWFEKALCRSADGRFLTVGEMAHAFHGATTSRPSAWEAVTGEPARARSKAATTR